MDFTEVNVRVAVAAEFPIGTDTARALRPLSMIYAGREVVFSELGLYHPVSKGHRMIHVFDMSDGNSDYRLEFDAERLIWKLVAITSC